MLWYIWQTEPTESVFFNGGSRKQELKNIILELADDLGRGCMITDEGSCEDPAWESKYIRCRKPGAV